MILEQLKLQLNNMEVTMQTKDKEEIREAVRESYGKIAKSATVITGISAAPSCCGQPHNSGQKMAAASCCGHEATPEQTSTIMGYSKPCRCDRPRAT